MRRMIVRAWTVSVLLAAASFPPALARDAGVEKPPPAWPQWRGPERTNASTETGLLRAWPKDGPPLVWKAEGLGGSATSISVAGGRVFALGYHEEGEYLLALDEATGKHLWKVL